MNKFTLICEEDSFLISSTSKTTKEFEAESLDEVLSNVAQFLRGVGFVFDGELQICNDVTLECPENELLSDTLDLWNEWDKENNVEIDLSNWSAEDIVNLDDIEINWDEPVVVVSSEPEEQPVKKKKKK